MHAGEYSINKNTLVEQSYQGRLLERGVVILLFEDGADQTKTRPMYLYSKRVDNGSFLSPSMVGESKEAFRKIS